ncbi:MAG: glycosyl hydrolase family 5 [Hyphomicrobiales bacterium]|nr:MAG: glycosyl hydrolase family 5 [Hyphomicrobiales bacterium]
MKRMIWLVLAPALTIATAIPAAELVANGGFDTDATGWWATQNLTLEARDGRLCATIPGGTTNPWDAIIGTNDLPLVKGESYEFSFATTGDPGGPVRALVQMPVDPWTSYVEATPRAAPEEKATSRKFKAPVDRPDAQIVFQVGGSRSDWTLCLDQVSLNSGTEVAVYKPDTGPRIRVNQLGYLPDGPKRATLVSEASGPLPFSLRDASGATLFEGTTTPRGLDPSAGLKVHTLDFTAADATGSSLIIAVDGETSYPFAIAPGLYAPLVVDALSYFYPVRSGIAIDAAIAGEGYGRPAGHLSVAPNKGDADVPCQPPAASAKVYGEPWSCDYRLDVTGGWYDAGDHGKYVVNGGISVAQLMAAFRRASRAGEPDVVGDGTLRLPEQGNGVPDILDEARWELEWMLKMVVPDGQPLAGMVHHKIHDNEWTGIPLLPSNDDKQRELHRPSTAATLNFAAVAAAGARHFAFYDKPFADRLLLAARKSYQAALDNPAIFAPAADGDSGGGPYDDTELSDEFYWAAAELTLATGDPAYRADLYASPHWAGDIFDPDGFGWQSVGAFARLTLALEPASGFSGPQAAALRQSVLDGADKFLALQAGEPFGQSYSPVSGKYEWGSSHLVVQNAIVLATAYDISGAEKYRQGALEAMDYLLGRNALNLSFITGYGTRYAHNQHSRWFARSVNAEMPEPPRGALAGGPNSSIQDPVAQGLFAERGCAPQLCYVDDIQAWSVNEITINWNAALGQFAAWLAVQ